MSKQITMIVDKEGNRDISTEGFTGEDCLEAARPLVGDEDADVRLTDEYYEVAEEHETVNAGGDS